MRAETAGRTIRNKLTFKSLILVPERPTAHLLPTAVRRTSWSLISSLSLIYILLPRVNAVARPLQQYNYTSRRHRPVIGWFGSITFPPRPQEAPRALNPILLAV